MLVINFRMNTTILPSALKYVICLFIYLFIYLFIALCAVTGSPLLSFSLLMTTQETFVDSVDQDQTARNVQSDP